MSCTLPDFCWERIAQGQAIGAIIGVLDILPEERKQVPYMQNGHDTFNTQYMESVIEKVKDWLGADNYPNPINLNGKKYKVIYKERETDVSKEIR